MNTAATTKVISIPLLGLRLFQNVAINAALKSITAAPKKYCCVRAKNASFPTSAVLTPILTRMRGSTQQEAPMNAASPDRALLPAMNPPFLGSSELSSSLDIMAIVEPVATTGAS